MGIDYGTRKIGLALADEQNGLAEPLKTQFLTANFDIESDFGEILRENQVGKIVLSQPGGRQKEAVEIFGKKLEEKFKVKVEYFDETLTTLDARKILFKIGRKRKYKKKMEDAVAAALLLESYLERRRQNV